MITSAQNAAWPLDVPIGDLVASGLPASSLVRMKLFTLDHRLVLRKAGRLAGADQTAVEAALRSALFADPLAMLMADPDHSIGEERYVLLGESTKRNLLVVAFAERPPRTRLISARGATRHERRQYEEGKS